LNNNEIVVVFDYMATSTMVGLFASGQALPGGLPISTWVLALLVVWSVIWKGLALWKSARLSNKWWFIILLVVNTVGILDIIYIYFVARKYTVETEKVEPPSAPPSIR
jgi:methionyl-tRNA synthetase